MFRMPFTGDKIHISPPNARQINLPKLIVDESSHTLRMNAKDLLHMVEQRNKKEKKS